MAPKNIRNTISRQKLAPRVHLAGYFFGWVLRPQALLYKCGGHAYFSATMDPKKSKFANKCYTLVKMAALWPKKYAHVWALGFNLIHNVIKFGIYSLQLNVC